MSSNILNESPFDEDFQIGIGFVVRKGSVTIQPTDQKALLLLDAIGVKEKTNVRILAQYVIQKFP
jgi:hypothetical protein